mgnify:CR=1 FL=1
MRALLLLILLVLIPPAAAQVTMPAGRFVYQDLALAGNLFVAGTMGALIPLVLNRVGVDPAVASSIFVTAFTDVCGFLAFLGTATLLLSRLQP